MCIITKQEIQKVAAIVESNGIEKDELIGSLLELQKIVTELNGTNKMIFSFLVKKRRKLKRKK